MAWFMIGTEIQVLITKQSTPALSADALEGRCTSAVITSRIEFTFIAIWSLPSAFASVNIEGEKHKH